MKKKNLLKLSFDISEKNRDVLEAMKAACHVPYGTLLNRIIGTFCDLPETVRENLMQFCSEQAYDSYSRMSQAGPIMFEELKRDTECYNNIIAFLYDNGHVSKAAGKIQRILFGCGEVLCPEDWVVVNPEKAGMSISACAVEADGPFAKHLPHLLFFSNQRSVRNASDDYKQNIRELCYEKCPEFRVVSNDHSDHIFFYDIPIYGERQNGGSSVRDAIIIPNYA